MASACIRSSSSNADLDEEVGKTRRAFFSTAKRSRVSEEFPFLALLVAVGVSDGGKPVIILQSEVSVLTLPAFPLDEKHKHLSLAPRHTETGSSAVEVTKERECSTVWISCQGSARTIQRGEKSSEGLHFELPLLCLYQLIPHPAATKKKIKMLGVLRGYVLWFGCSPIQ